AGARGPYILPPRTWRSFDRVPPRRRGLDPTRGEFAGYRGAVGQCRCRRRRRSGPSSASSIAWDTKAHQRGGSYETRAALRSAVEATRATACSSLGALERRLAQPLGNLAYTDGKQYGDARFLKYDSIGAGAPANGIVPHPLASSFGGSMADEKKP